MKTVSTLKFIRKLSFLAFACSAVLFSSCNRADIFTSDFEEAKKIKEMLPGFGSSDIKDTDKVWDTIVKSIAMPVKIDSLLIVAYDDLMNPETFKSVLLRYPAWGAAVDVIDAHRSFNFHPAGPTSQVANINAEVIEGKESSETFSAVCYDVNKETFRALCALYNTYYDLVPVLVSSRTGEGYTVGYLFSVRDSKFHSSVKALPVQSHFQAIWDSVNSISPSEGFGSDFSSAYLKTTFLADGRNITTILPPPVETETTEFVS
ncbi:hypothetical protein [Chlamydia sp. 17-3921]|uniref:hypothetical protein n=1 Tax=Chlamydia sp. 17-3921 TaxID=2675798 RepID=UPI00191A140C|nr:hypothetical protein [Chlamydia sp. 17-3921]